jgi:hypothetical protein
MHAWLVVTQPISTVRDVEAKVVAGLRAANRPVRVAELEVRFGRFTALSLHRLRAIVGRHADTVQLTCGGYEDFSLGRQQSTPPRALNPPRAKRRG